MCGHYLELVCADSILLYTSVYSWYSWIVSGSDIWSLSGLAYSFAPEPEYPLDDRIKLAQLVDNCISHCDHLQYYHSPSEVFGVVVDLCSKLEALERALGPPASVTELLAEPGPARESYNIKANIQLKAHQCRQQYIEALASAGDLTSLEVKATRSSLKTLSSRLWH